MAPSCFMITLIFLPKLSNILKTWQSISKKKFSLPSVGWICRSSGMADGETEKRREKNQGKINHTPEARRWSLFLSFGWFHTTVVGRLGMPTSSKTDEFSKNFQTTFDSPPLNSKFCDGIMNITIRNATCVQLHLLVPVGDRS